MIIYSKNRVFICFFYVKIIKLIRLQQFISIDKDVLFIDLKLNSMHNCPFVNNNFPVFRVYHNSLPFAFVRISTNRLCIIHFQTQSTKYPEYTNTQRRHEANVLHQQLPATQQCECWMRETRCRESVANAWSSTLSRYPNSHPTACVSVRMCVGVSACIDAHQSINLWCVWASVFACTLETQHPSEQKNSTFCG